MISLTEAFFNGFNVPPNIPVDEWADQHRKSRKGQWKTRCFQREPLREMINPEVRSECIVGAAQTFGKSELALCYVGRQIAHDPGPMLIVQPSDGLAKRFSRKRVQPMIDEVESLRGLVSSKKGRRGANTLHAKEFPGGDLRIIGAESPGNLASDPTRDVLFDEVDRCQKSCGREGDIVTLGEARQEDFGPSAFSLYVSSPSGSKPKPLPLPEGEVQPEDVSKILLLFEETDKRFWFCPCQKCGGHQTLKWSQVVWPDGRPEEAKYMCEFRECLHSHNDVERVRMVEAGEWRATAPFLGKRGYFLNAIASLSQPQRSYRGKLHQLAATYLSAKRRGPHALVAWFNTQMCECFSPEQSETVAALPLFNRREKFGSKLNPLACIVTVGVDVHPDRLEAQVVAWGDGERSWTIDYHVLLGDTKKPEVWKMMDVELLKTYPHPLGSELGIERACFDTGHSPDQVYEFVAPRIHRGVIAIKGMSANGGRGRPLMNLPSRKTSIRRIRLWLVSKHTGLRTMLSRLKIMEDGPGCCHFPSDREPLFGIDYFRQLTAYEVRMIRRGGEEYEEFDPGQRRDEAMDTYIYALAALRQKPVDFSRLAQRVKHQAEALKEPKRPEESGIAIIHRGGWDLGGSNFATRGMHWRP